MSKATINDIKSDPRREIKSNEKLKLVKIIEDEFVNRTTLLESQRAERELEIRQEWMKMKGVDKLQKQINKLKNQVDLLESEVREKGSISHYGYPTGPEWENFLKARMGDQFREPRTQKNKIITRLLSCTTWGEAHVIVTYVMGNGLIPEVSKDDLPKLQITR